MPKSNEFQKVGDIFNNIKNIKTKTKPPAYLWQEFALEVIKELSIPNFKRNSVFKICKQFPRALVEKALNDTKELCQTGQKWKYFFKIINQK